MEHNPFVSNSKATEVFNHQTNLNLNNSINLTSCLETLLCDVSFHEKPYKCVSLMAAFGRQVFFSEPPVHKKSIYYKIVHAKCIKIYNLIKKKKFTTKFFSVIYNKSKTRNNTRGESF